MNEEKNILPVGEQEAEEPEIEVISDNTRYVHVFKEPFQWQGKEYDQLTFDFSSLRGKDVLAITQELRLRGIVLAMKTFDVDYQYRYAARCCQEKPGADMLLALPVKDFDAICNAVQRFLASSGR